MKKNLGFRSWFYFRTGWSIYFAFIFAAINTLTVTFYLAVENYPFLKEIFPSFISYIAFFGVIGIPLLIAIGWIHYKRSAGFSSEAEISFESNPIYFRLPPGWYIQVMFPLFLKLSEFLVKYSKDEKFSKEEITEIAELQKKIQTLIEGGMVGSPKEGFKR